MVASAYFADIYLIARVLHLQTKTGGIQVLDFKKLFKRSTEEQEGQGLVEYALILFLVAVVVIAILILLGPQVGRVFSSVKSGIS